MSATDRDVLADQLDAVAQRGHGRRFLAPFFQGVVDLVLAAGWRPPAREITTAADLAELAATWPCVIREQPADPTDFYPAMWEMGFQVGWCRAGQMYDPDDCTPTLPVTVLYAPTEEAGRG